MKKNEKIHQKLKKFRTSLSKKKLINKSKEFNLDKKKYIEYEEDFQESLIKSNSLNKFKKRNKSGNNIKKDTSIKLPSLKQHIYINNNINEIDSNLLKNLYKSKSGNKIKINTKSISNLHANNKSSKKLLTKNTGSSFNLKISQKFKKSNNINFNTNGNIGVVRHLDRKIIKKNQNIMKPKKAYKLLTTTKIINNFNNHINQNKNKEIFTIINNNNNLNNENKKIDVIYDLEEKVSNIQNSFLKELKEEENEDRNIPNQLNNNIIDIISDISLSEEELNFSEENSFDNFEFSLEDEEIE